TAGFDQLAIQRLQFAAGGGGLRTQPLGALHLGAAVALGLRGGSRGLRVSAADQERKRPCRACDEGADALCVSSHAPSPISPRSSVPVIGSTAQYRHGTVNLFGNHHSDEPMRPRLAAESELFVCIILN